MPWQNTISESLDPVFILGRHNRLQFVNPAWEALTGLTLAEVRGAVCKRQPRQSEGTLLEDLLGVLAPPRAVTGGQFVEVRRLAPLHLSADGARWWDISFVPLRGAKGLTGILGRIAVVAGGSSLSRQLLPESIIAIRQRHYQHFVLDASGSCAPGSRIVEQIHLAAQTRVAVSLVGEPGTGKHWMARAIHRLSSQRERPFARFDCASLPPAVLDEGIFGQRGLVRSGGFGTIYLHEPAALPRELQATLADAIVASSTEDVVEERPRFITGFGVEAKGELQRGRLAPQLFAVLGPIQIELPPLRERTGDIPSFVEFFLRRAAELKAITPRTISAEALQYLSAHQWPGNLHELHQVILAAHGRGGDRIEAHDLPFYLRAAPAPAERSLPLDALLEQVEKRLIVIAMRLAQDNKTKAAEILSIWRPRLLRRLEAFGLTEASEEPPA